MDTTKKRDIGSGIRNVGKLFKRKEKQSAEQDNAVIKEKSPQIVEDQRNDELDSETNIIEPETASEEEVQEPSEMDTTSAITLEMPVEENKEKEEVVIPAKTIDHSNDAIPLPQALKIGVSKESPDQNKSRPKKSDGTLFTGIRTKGKVDKKEQEVSSKYQEAKEEKKRIVTENQRVVEKATKPTLETSKIAEIKVKMRKILAVSTRVRIDMLKEYLQVDGGQFIQYLIDWANEFGYKIDGDYIVLDTMVVGKFTLK